jgi:nitrogen fixation NifU-like protein
MRTAGPTATNPLCGDQLNVYLHVEGRSSAGRERCEGAGCAISKASASMMNAGRPKGKTKAEAETLFHEIPIGMATGELDKRTNRTTSAKPENIRRRFANFSGHAWKCATPPWAQSKQMAGGIE